MSALRGVRMKLDRARQHLKDLQAACDRFVRDNPHTPPGVRIEQNSDVGEFIIRAIVPIELPDDMSGAVGDALHNLRSALDALAWQLVLANGVTPGTWTEFPIFKEEPKFKSEAPRRMHGMSTTARRTIEELQPYKAWPEHPEHATLWKIHNMAIIDKHRVPHAPCLWLERVQAAFRHPENTDAELVYGAPRGPLEDGAVLLHLRWDPAKMKAAGDVDMGVEFQIALDVAIQSPEADFLSDRLEPLPGAPIQHLFNVALDYLDNTLLPAFAAEFD